jgi:hypothetical protein
MKVKKANKNRENKNTETTTIIIYVYKDIEYPYNPFNEIMF